MKLNFSKRQIKDFVLAVRTETGDGWKWLVPRVKEALIAERALYVLAGQHKDTVETDQINLLLDAMPVEAELRTEDK